MRYAPVQNHVGGRFVAPDVPLPDVFDPSSGEVISRVPLSSARDVDESCARRKRRAGEEADDQAEQG
jgi:acyl-CoA reductase-like NAD-dependent aldehyde dehydrogenase